MEGENEAGRGDGAAAVAEVLAALGRAVAGGPAVLESLLRQPDAASALGLVMAILGRGAGREEPGQGAAAAGAAIPGAAVSGAAISGAAISGAAEAIGFVGQAYMIAAASGFRFWRRVAETAGEHQLDLLRTVSEGGRGGQGELIDGLRAYARELGDLSLQEARLFQAELDRLAVSLAHTDDPPPDDAYRRRWRAKP
jgi:hypothetical protein